MIRPVESGDEYSSHYIERKGQEYYTEEHIPLHLDRRNDYPFDHLSLRIAYYNWASYAWLLSKLMSKAALLKIKIE